MSPADRAGERPVHSLLRQLDQAVRGGRPAALVRILKPWNASPEPPAGSGSPVLPGTKLLVLEEGEPRSGEGGPPGGPVVLGTTGNRNLDDALVRAARGLLARGASARLRVAGADVFVQSFTPPPVLCIVGAVHPAAALAAAGRFLGFRVTVCDPRSPFATPERLPAADAIVREWPDRYLARAQLTERDAVCILTHDLKFDVPAIQAALASRAGYVGVMGSGRTQERRRAALREAGVSEEALQRLFAPIGLDIGARSPEELAVAIVAQIIAVRNGRLTPAGAGGGAGPRDP